MQTWLFRGAGQVCALTADRTGAVLPPSLGPWSRVRSVSLDHDDADEEQARALIRLHGFCYFDAGEDDAADEG